MVMSSDHLPTVERLMLMMLFLHERLFAHWTTPSPPPVLLPDEMVVVDSLRKRGLVEHDSTKLNPLGTATARKMWVP